MVRIVAFWEIQPDDLAVVEIAHAERTTAARRFRLAEDLDDHLLPAIHLPADAGSAVL
jgi:hypothetical protein